MENKDLEQSGTILALKEQAKEMKGLKIALYFCGFVAACFLIFILWVAFKVINNNVVGNLMQAWATGGC